MPVANVEQLFNRFGVTSINGIKNRIVDSKAYASGKSSSSLRQESTHDEFTIFGANYFKWMEQGRGPGKVPRNFQDIIIQWMKDKGITPKVDTEQGYKTAAYFISRKIVSSGTLLFRNKTLRDIFTSVINENSINNLFQEIGSVKSKEVATDIIKNLK